MACGLAFGASLTPTARGATAEFPAWAYGVTTAPQPGDKATPQNPPSRQLRPNQPEEEQTRPRHVAGSTATYSLLDIRDGHNVTDWFPEDHPPMTDILRHGAARLADKSLGCALCHLPTGKGRPENAPVVGLPVPYFIRQLEDFRSGKRASADPRKPNVPTMSHQAAAMTPEEMQQAAEYFGAMEWTPWTRVVETDLVPKTRIVGNLFLPLETARTEPIAGRIIEVPEDEEQSELLRNPRSGFVAYVPKGSLKKGEHLVVNGGATIVGGKTTAPGKTVICATCHGPDLLGLLEVPGIAGRSPSYLVRQLYDFQRGTRKGIQAVTMEPVVANLSADDMLAIAAYVTSLSQPKIAAARPVK